MAKVPFVTKEQLDEIVKKLPTPFHLYVKKEFVKQQEDYTKPFSWNKGFKEYFAVKATQTNNLKDFKRRRMQEQTAHL